MPQFSIQSAVNHVKGGQDDVLSICSFRSIRPDSLIPVTEYQNPDKLLCTSGSYSRGLHQLLIHGVVFPGVARLLGMVCGDDSFHHLTNDILTIGICRIHELRELSKKAGDS